MNVKLTPHAAELLEAVRAQRPEPVESIVEHALEILARAEHIQAGTSEPTDDPRQRVAEMIDFIEHNRTRLEVGVTVKDLLHEGHRI